MQIGFCCSGCSVFWSVIILMGMIPLALVAPGAVLLGTSFAHRPCKVVDADIIYIQYVFAEMHGSNQYSIRAAGGKRKRKNQAGSEKRSPH